MFLSTDIGVGIKARVDSSLIAKQIFNTFIYPYQLYTIAISSNLRKFFNKNNHYKTNPILSSKSSWKFNRREECDSIVKKWQMYFQASNYKRKHFLDLNNDNNHSIQPIYSKGSAWLKHFGLSNLLYVCITRLITNHTPISKYRLRFFSNKPFKCLLWQLFYQNKNSHSIWTCTVYKVMES